MNEKTNTMAQPEKPARPSDKHIANAFYEMDSDVTDLRRAAVVLDEYITFELRAARASGNREAFPYMLNQSQADGITYMAMHVRDLACMVERKFDDACGRGAGQ